MVDYAQKQIAVDRKIQKAGMLAILRRTSGDRFCYVLETDFTPQERAGKLVNPTDRIFLCSPLYQGNPIVPPDNTQDTLVTLVQPITTSPPTEFEKLKLFEPAGRLAPGGIPIYYELKVRG